MSKNRCLYRNYLILLAFTLVFFVNMPAAFAGGKKATPPPPPPCGDWNDAGNFTGGGSFAGSVSAIIDTGKPSIPVANASVELSSNNRAISTNTNQLGAFTFPLLENATWKVRVKKSGYRYKSKVTTNSQLHISMDACL